MRILFTGASSFTGFWFVRELTSAGHEVTATFTRSNVEAYGTDVRGRRVGELQNVCRPAFACRFGDERFTQLIQESGPWDVLCHHAADVTDYKSPDFDIAGALANNTYNADTVLRTLATSGCQRMAITGTVFEPGEGAGSQGLPAFSPYGVSKALTAQVFAFYARRYGLRLGKFVIPNPFGPYEEPRFTAYLLRTWHAGKTATVRTPAYIRDNIHVSLLAKAYVDWMQRPPTWRHGNWDNIQLNPSGYVESQGVFAQRFAREMGSRLGIDCPLEVAIQTEFDEPHIRINTDPLDARRLEWDETAAWDDLADYGKSDLHLSTRKQTG